MTDLAVWKTWEGRLVDGRFPLRQWLGGSDHSAVFLTELPDQKSRNAAIKLIPADGGDPEAQLTRWRAAARLSGHPNLIRLLEMGRAQFDNTPFLYVVMEHAEEDLSQILPQRALNTEEASAMLPAVLEALSYLHGKGFIHGRIKPANVMACDNQLKVSGDSVSSVGTPVSTQHALGVYDAPESGSGPLSPAADIWSVGALIAATLMQQPPTGGARLQQDMNLPDAIQQPFRDIARACLRNNPAERCSIAEIKEMLADHKLAPAVAPTARSVPVSVPPIQLRQPLSKSRFWAPLILLFVVIAIFTGSKLLTRHDEIKSAPETETTAAPAQSASVQNAPAAQATGTPPATPKTASGKGEVLHQVLPDVPQSAKNTITGTIKVTVRAEVDSSGKVTSAKLTTAGSSQYFARLAVQAAQRWQFTPPQTNGQATASTWSLRFQFRKGSTQAFPSRVAPR